MTYGTRGPIPHSQRLYTIPYPELNQFNFLVLAPIYFNISSKYFSYIPLGLLRGLFSVGLSVKVLKALLPSTIQTTCPAHLNLLDLITLGTLGEIFKPGINPKQAYLLLTASFG